MTKSLISTLALCLSLTAQAKPIKQLPDLSVSDRGELQLDKDEKIHYTPWRSTPIQAPGKIGLFMLMPARPSSRKAIATLKQAMSEKNYDYQQLISTTVVNLDDAVIGAGMLVGGELKQDKQKTPALHLIVDETGDSQQTLGLARKTIHVLIHDCKRQILYQHEGAVSTQIATDMLNILDQALAGPACSATQGTTQ